MPKRNGDDLAQTLLAKAAGDEIVLSKLIRDAETPDEVLGFHAQQAVEKLLKGVLATRRVDHPRTHDIDRLLEIVAEAGIELPQNAETLDALTPWAAAFRYEDASAERLDRSKALDAVTQVRAWAESQLG